MSDTPLTRIHFRHEADPDGTDLPLFRNGVTFTFASGMRLSIQCGSTNYCEMTGKDTAANAEIAVIGPSGGWMTKAIVAGALGEELDDDVRGRTTVEEIAKIMAHIEGWVS